MKTMKRLFFAFLIVAGIAACSTDTSDDYCFQQALTGVDEVTGPETTTVNEPIELQVSFKINNGCGEFYRFQESNGFPKQIVAVVNYVGCVCTEMVEEATEPYTFQASQAGEYVLKFAKPDNTFITKTITVTE